MVLTTSSQAQETLQPFNPDYRDVYWMHGLNGKGHYMQGLADYFGNMYQMNSYSPEYPSTLGIDHAANYWRRYDFDRRNDNFVVTQSMGGLVARYYDQRYADNRFNGLITIAAPHLGSEFANSFDNGKLKSFFDGVLNDGVEGFAKAVVDMPLVTLVLGVQEKLVSDLEKEFEKLRPNLTKQVDGKSKALLALDYIVFFMLPSSFEWPVSNVFARITSNNVTKQLQRFGITLGAMAANTVFGEAINGVYMGKEELKYNSPIVRSINNGAPFHNRNTINIVGKAKDNIDIRFLSSTLDKDKLTDWGRNSIGLVKDDGLQSFINNYLIAKSQALSADFSKVGNISGWAAALHFLLLAGDPLATVNAVKLLSKRSTCKEIAAAFDRQTNFWRYTFESRYETCLGNKYYTTSTETYYERVWVDDGPIHGPKPGAGLQPGTGGPIDFIEEPIIGDDMPGSSNGHWEYIPRTYTVTHTHTHPSDGIVTLPSQKGWKEASVTIEIDDVDHESVKRSWNTVKALESIFNKKGDFFEIPLREKALTPEPILPKPGKPLPRLPDDGPIMILE
ncbi:MAG: hypothetical protein IJU72_09435 [Bacteroidales bacterium]|nr:hypothetical protein [Bacteroidales bacterium]